MTERFTVVERPLGWRPEDLAHVARHSPRQAMEFRSSHPTVMILTGEFGQDFLRTNLGDDSISSTVVEGRQNPKLPFKLSICNLPRKADKN